MQSTGRLVTSITDMVSNKIQQLSTNPELQSTTNTNYNKISYECRCAVTKQSTAV